MFVSVVWGVWVYVFVCCGVCVCVCACVCMCALFVWPARKVTRCLGDGEVTATSDLTSYTAGLLHDTV